MRKERVLSPPAFPIPDLKAYGYRGLTKRELYSALAMFGMLANPTYNEQSFESLADQSIGAADALIERSLK